jgi:CheY-like chemotaxis protein
VAAAPEIPNNGAAYFAAEDGSARDGNAQLPPILIVDDNQPTARALAALLKGAKYRTAVSFRGADALAHAEKSDFAAAVVDIHLPDISGLVVSQKLRERFGPHVPIIVLSGDTSMQMLNSLQHVGATYFFSKPVNAMYLLERLREWIGATGADGSASSSSSDGAGAPV